MSVLRPRSPAGDTPSGQGRIWSSNRQTTRPLGAVVLTADEAEKQAKAMEEVGKVADVMRRRATREYEVELMTEVKTDRRMPRTRLGCSTAGFTSRSTPPSPPNLPPRSN